ncbi:d-2-hydroxyglutarate dehydrogenase [Tropilaelaps mercedesae]|uniref:D-2-hydroxyglutarate dehydrogenase, mitochondrial n=1 Tax=Tropilaelaps mercedesae TaxID=418985 RepID=A0A1V9XLE2_9ACAR|nr:d-2-hydroxyglutarate dehydrogenase [Tropilaelaps mercedesae]
MILNRWQIGKRYLNVSLARQARVAETRGSFSAIQDKDVTVFERLLGTQGVVTDPDELGSYNKDWLNTFQGSSRVALLPRNSAEVSEILRFCNDRCLAVVPQGGNTGLVGGGVPVFDEIVLSTRRMDKLHEVDDLTGIAVVDAGMVLESLDQRVASLGFTVPLDLAAKGSCHIGGNISTNAGGLRLIKYGSLHGSVIGLEAVLADGTVLNGLSNVRKDNTGVDMKQLFIGSEGILGVVTRIAWMLPSRPAFNSVAILGCDNFERVLDVYKMAKNGLAEFLSALEMFDHSSLQCVEDNVGITNPLGKPYSFYVLVEIQGSDGAVIESSLNRFVENIMDRGVVADGVASSDGRGVAELWQRRERISESIKKDGYVFKYDMSVPLRNYIDLGEKLKPRVKGLAKRVCVFGHMGDSNVHLNVTADEYSDQLFAQIEPFVYEETVKMGGSISAEHGIGLLKKKYLPLQRNAHWLNTMAIIKRTMDPKRILNPYKII